MSETFAPISASTNESYCALVTAVPHLMTVMVLGTKSKSMITKFEVTPDDAMAFLEAVIDIFDGKCQAILFHIFNFKPVGFAHIMSFGYELRCRLSDNQIHTFFYSGQSLFTSGLLVSAKVNSIKNDILLVVRVKGTDRLTVTEYLFTDLGYEQTREEGIENAEEETAQDLREKILHETKPKHIVVYGDSVEMPMMKKLKKSVFSQEKIHRLDKAVLKESIVQTLKIAKYVHDRNYVKYHIIPKCAKDFAVYFENREEPIFSIKAGDTLPFYKEIFAFRDAVNMSVFGFDDATMEKRLYYTYHMKDEESQKRHRSKLVFYVDHQSFPIVRSNPIVVDIILELPTKLDKLLSKKIPVIAFCDNYSVICAIKKDEEHYSYLDGWNGLYGHDAAMFVKGLNRVYGIGAKKMKEENPINCITNLIELMSRDDLSYIIEPAFPDANTFELADLQQARVEILCAFMTKFLEEHFKVIRDETGQSPKEIAIWLVFEDQELFKERLLICFKHFEINFHFLQLELPKD